MIPLLMPYPKDRPLAMVPPRLSSGRSHASRMQRTGLPSADRPDADYPCRWGTTAGEDTRDHGDAGGRFRSDGSRWRSLIRIPARHDRRPHDRLRRGGSVPDDDRHRHAALRTHGIGCAFGQGAIGSTPQPSKSATLRVAIAAPWARAVAAKRDQMCLVAGSRCSPGKRPRRALSTRPVAVMLALPPQVRRSGHHRR